VVLIRIDETREYEAKSGDLAKEKEEVFPRRSQELKALAERTEEVKMERDILKKGGEQSSPRAAQ